MRYYADDKSLSCQVLISSWILQLTRHSPPENRLRGSSLGLTNICIALQSFASGNVCQPCNLQQQYRSMCNYRSNFQLVYFCQQNIHVFSDKALHNCIDGSLIVSQLTLHVWSAAVVDHRGCCDKYGILLQLFKLPAPIWSFIIRLCRASNA